MNFRISFLISLLLITSNATIFANDGHDEEPARDTGAISRAPAVDDVVIYMNTADPSRALRSFKNHFPEINPYILLEALYKARDIAGQSIKKELSLHFKKPEEVRPHHLNITVYLPKGGNTDMVKNLILAEYSLKPEAKPTSIKTTLNTVSLYFTPEDFPRCVQRMVDLKPNTRRTF